MTSDSDRRPLASSALAFLTKHRVRLIDVALFADAIAMLTLDNTVLFFHLIFVFLSIQAFYLRFRPFILRAIPWVTFTTMVVLEAIVDGSTQPEEIIEIPLLSVILLTVFFIAARRESARGELERTKTLLEQVLETTEDGIFAADKTGRIILRNRVALQMQQDAAVAAVISRAVRGETVVEELSLGEGATSQLVLATAKLLPHNNGALLVTHDITARKKLEQELAYRASHDPLTKLANRAMFRERALAIQARQRRSGGLFALMVLDLDDFKTVNDSLGHAAGDALLIAVAERIGDTTRGNDVVARLGGDEFAIVLDDVHASDGVITAAERILAAMRLPFTIEDRVLHVEASIGIVTSAKNDETIEDHLRNADVAMYMAKSRGKARYEFFEHSMHDAVLLRLDMRADLQHAISHDEFQLHYQPIVDLKSGSVVAVESLIRWAHPRRGLLEPTDFLALAEETGMIIAMGHWVIRQACLQASGWPKDVAVTVNFSIKELRDAGLPAAVRRALEESGLAPSRLIVEVTEGAIQDANERVLLALQELREMGVRLAIDDFGTGYSSISRLRRLPAQFLKVDRSFMEDLAAGVAAPELDAALRLADAFGYVSVAEGIERPEQADILRGLGCALGQGFLFSAPVPAGQLSVALTANYAVVTPRIASPAAKSAAIPSATD